MKMKFYENIYHFIWNSNQSTDISIINKQLQMIGIQHTHQRSYANFLSPFIKHVNKYILDLSKILSISVHLLAVEIQKAEKIEIEI